METDLRQTIMNDAEQYIPFDIEDVYLDFKDLETGRTNLTALMSCWWRQA